MPHRQAAFPLFLSPAVRLGLGLGLLLGPLFSLAPAAAGEQTAELPLKRVVLFTSGVGYFQRDGEVDGDARVELRFDADDVNDLLKSLVLRDFDGGEVGSVTYGSRDPVTRTLKAFAIDLTKRPSLAEILAQVRGEAVEIVSPVPIQGIIVGVEKRKVPAGDGNVVEEEFLNLLTDQGLHAVALSGIQRVRFLREQLDAELRRALATLAQSHDTQKKPVTLRFSGQGKRRVSVAYITETPVWKTSYRLVLGDEKPLLQGWAIVENTTDEDWKDVRLTLVSGRPLSFIMDLYQPLYVKRPEMKLELYESLRPQKYAKAIEEFEAEKGAREPARARRGLQDALGRPAARRAKDKKRGSVLAGVRARARGGDVGELFRYDLTAPVSLPRQDSALLPIVNARVGAEKVSIYNESVHAKHPLNGLRLANTTTLHLMQGPITVFDGGVYAGDAWIDDLAPGGRRLLSYAMDLDTEVEPVTKSAPAVLLSVRLAKGTLIATRRLRRQKTYRIASRGAKPRTVLVEHPFQADWELREPKPLERTRAVYRFSAAVAPGKSATVNVVEERRLEQVVALANLRTDAIELYLRAPEVSAKVKEALKEVARRQQELSALRAQVRRHETRVEEIGVEQRRIRDNMGRLSRNSQLYERYVTILTKQEDELADLHRQLGELRRTQETKQKELDAYLLSLDLE